MRDAFLSSLDTISKSDDDLKNLGFDSKEIKKFREADLSTNEIDALKRAVRSIAEDSQYKDFFGVRPFNHNWEDIMARSGLNINKKSDYAPIEDAVQLAFLNPAMKKYVSMLKIITCLPGSTTIYGGDELGETGYDTVSNDYLQNRNRLHWEWLDNKDFIKAFNEEVTRIFNFRNDKRLSPLVNGYTILLKMPLKSNPADDKGTDLAAIYRYNDESDIIAVLNKAGFNNTREAFNFYPQYIDCIDLSYSPDIKCPRGIPGGLEEGAIYKNANINKWEAEEEEKRIKENQPEKYYYKVNDNKLKKYETGTNNPVPIYVNGPALLLYRAKKFDGNENK